MSVLKHTTSQGEKLDQIAFTYYGDVSKVPMLIEANPHLPIQRNYPAGVVVYIPLIKQESTNEDLPPWLQP